MFSRSSIVALWFALVASGLSVFALLHQLCGNLFFSLPVNRWIIGIAAIGLMIIGALVAGPVLAWWRRSPDDASQSDEPEAKDVAWGIVALFANAAVFVVGVYLVAYYMLPQVVASMPEDVKPSMDVEIPGRPEVFDDQVILHKLESLDRIGSRWLKAFFDEPTSSGSPPSTGLIPALEKVDFVPYLGPVGARMRAEGYNTTARRSSATRAVVSTGNVAKARELVGRIERKAKRLRDLYDERVKPFLGHDARENFLDKFIAAYEEVADITIEGQDEVKDTPQLSKLAELNQTLTDIVTPTLTKDQVAAKGTEYQELKDKSQAADKTWTSAEQVIIDALDHLRAGKRDAVTVAGHLKRTTELLRLHAWVAKEIGTWKTQLVPALQKLQKGIDPQHTNRFANDPDRKPLHDALQDFAKALRETLNSPPTNAGADPPALSAEWEPASLLATVEDFLTMEESWNAAQIPLPGGGTAGLYDAIKNEWASTFLVGSPPEVNPTNCPKRADAQRRALAIAAKHIRQLIPPLIAKWTPPSNATKAAMPSREQESLQTGGRCPPTLPGAPFQLHFWRDKMPQLNSMIESTGISSDQLKTAGLIAAINANLGPNSAHNDAIRAQLVMVERYLFLLDRAYNDADKLAQDGFKGLGEAADWYDIFEAAGGGKGPPNPLRILFKATQGIPEKLPPKDKNGKRDWNITGQPRAGGLTSITPSAIEQLLVPPPPVVAAAPAQESTQGETPVITGSRPKE